MRSVWTLAVSLSICGMLPGVLAPESAVATECLEIAATLNPGDTMQLTVDAPVWVELLGALDGVYQLELASGEPTDVEIWALDFNEVCMTRDSMLIEREIGPTSSAMQWTNPTFHGIGLLIEPAVGAGVVDVALTYHEIATPPSADVHVIPAAAHIIGANGELFRTDVTVFNHAGAVADVTLRFIPADGELPAPHNVQVGPTSVLAIRDVVGEIFGRTGEAGALWVEGVRWGRLSVVSRTYATTERGTYGQFIPAQPWNEAAGRGSSGDRRTVLHLAKSASFRSNVGFVEVLGLDAEIELEMIGDEGEVLAEDRITLSGLRHHQINDIFGFMGVEPCDNASLQVTVLTDARIFCYGSVVDNLSADPIFVRGLVPEWRRLLADADTHLLIPAAASVDGAFGTHWQSDLRVVAVDGAASSVSVRFTPADGSTPATGVFDVADGGPLAIADVVATLGSTGSGFLEIFSEPAEIMATSRTSTLGEHGSFGQFIPTASNQDDANRGMLLGLESSAEFRSNVAMTNLRDVPIRMGLHLYSGDNRSLGHRAVTVPPRARVQINQVLRAFGSDDCRDCRLEFVNEDGGRGVHVHGSVIDNRSGDAVYLPPMLIEY